MGADVWIENKSAKKNEYGSLLREAKESLKQAKPGSQEAAKAEDLVEHYECLLHPEYYGFRDNYNPTNFLSQHYGICWVFDIAPRLERRKWLPLIEAERILRALESHDISRQKVAEICEENGFQRGVDWWMEFFTQQRDILMEMLRKSLADKEMLACSL